MPSVPVRDVDLHYEEIGSGAPLVVAHGLLGSVARARETGLRPRDLAARGLRIIAYDARGHGRSGFTRRRADYTWSSHAADLAGLIAALEIPRASILGDSMGAGTALLVALDYPERVDRLILTAPPPFGANLALARRTFVGLSYLYQLLGTSFTAQLAAMLPNLKRWQQENPMLDLVPWLADQRRDAAVPAIRGLLVDSAPLPTDRFAEIAHKTLVLAHRHDPIHPLASGELLRASLPSARLTVAPDPGFWQRNPDALCRLVAAFALDGEVEIDVLQRAV